jgi:hypothetical protein
MNDIVTAVKVFVGPIIRAIIWVRHRRHTSKGEAEGQAILQELRRDSATRANCHRPNGSSEDRLYQELAAKGQLVKTPFGYMLPEFYRGFGDA